ncbi:hypothetical protein IPZ89_004782, partial [Escherichia coli]
SYKTVISIEQIVPHTKKLKVILIFNTKKIAPNTRNKKLLMIPKLITPEDGEPLENSNARKKSF